MDNLICHKMIELRGRDGSNPVLSIAECQAVSLLSISFVRHRFHACPDHRPISQVS